MFQRFELSTLFDCTNTGVKSYRKSVDVDQETHQYQRNQQRNFETIIQCLSLRCQPMNITGPYVFSNNESQLYWQIGFEIDKSDIFRKDDNPVGILNEDFSGVPMIIGLGENVKELFQVI